MMDFQSDIRLNMINQPKDSIVLSVKDIIWIFSRFSVCQLLALAFLNRQRAFRRKVEDELCS